MQTFSEVHAQARAFLGKSSERQKKNYDVKAKPMRFHVGEAVYYFRQHSTVGRSPKLQYKWEGPFLIISQLSDVLYRIKGSLNAATRVVHVDNLKPYVGSQPAWMTKVEVKLGLTTN